jgi:hypothetical protein
MDVSARVTASSTCHDCGASLRFGRHSGEVVPLDAHEVVRGEHRFAETPEGLVRVSASADVLAFTDHRETCPGKQRGGR